LHIQDSIITVVMVRQELGDFCSIACFKAAIVGMEEALGEKAAAIALTTAGRARGKKLAQDLNLVGQSLPIEVFKDKLAYALGKDGTCLCIINEIVEEGDLIKVYASETLCSADEEEGSHRKCTFTMGAIWGALEGFLGKRFQGKHTEFVLKGGSHDVFEFTVLAKN
jgi:predicted hydrocarbon binding protein